MLIQPLQRRRQLLVLWVCAWTVVVAGCGWTLAHVSLGHARAVAPTVVSVFAGIAMLLAMRRGAAGLALLLFSLTAWSLILLLSLTLDIPNEQVPRGIHHYLIPLFIAQRFLLQGQPAWLHNGVPLLSLALFGVLHLLGNPLNELSPMSDEQRLMGLRVTALLSLTLSGLLLRLQRIELRERAGLPVALARAIADKRLEPRFRPQCDSALRPIGACLLPHWPERPAMSAELLRGVAARNGLGDALARWERQCALSLLQDWAGQPGLQRLELCLPLGLAALRDGEALAQLLADALAAPTLAERLGLSVDEGDVAEVGDRLGAQLQACRDAGLHITLDNFGVGRSSLMHLESLPIDRLQIDAELVQAVDIDLRGREVLSGVVALGRRLGLEIAAKGAASAALLQQLRELGCRRFELPGDPLVLSALGDWVQAREASP